MPFNRQLFSAAIQARLLQQGLSLREAAKESGVSASTISRLLNGEIPDLGSFQAITCWLQADANMFLDHIPRENREKEAWTGLIWDLQELGVPDELIEVIVVIVRHTGKKG